MRFQTILCLVALLGAVQGSRDAKHECNIKAWVRAPDLVPNTIVQGDARVKISAGCPAIDNVSLGLRFKERSFVKALRSRDDVKWLNPQPAKSFNPRSQTPWGPTTRIDRFANESVREAHQKTFTNKDLWIVREEERMVFETMQPFDIGVRRHGTLRDAVQDFFVLVPSTNFPPILNVWKNRQPLQVKNREITDAEWIYEYFAQVAFTDGTTKEVSAGYTAFQPLHEPSHAAQVPNSTVVRLEELGVTKESLAETQSAPIASYSIEISANPGLVFSAGRRHILTGVVTRTGFARTFHAGLTFGIGIIPNCALKWAVKYDVTTPDINQWHFEPVAMLRTTLDRGKPAHGYPLHSFRGFFPVIVVMPNSTEDEIQAHEIVTTSANFTFSIEVDGAHIPDLDTYYQTIVNALTIRMGTPCSEDELDDPDGPTGKTDPVVPGPQFEDDEEAWVPWYSVGRPPRAYPLIWRTYTGRVPVVIHAHEVTGSQGRLHGSADMSGQVVLSAGQAHERPALIHYLDEGARGPVFVDPSVVHGLLTQKPAERQLRAPVLEPVTSSPPRGEELVSRYYCCDGPGNPKIYVGETWALKVANKG